MNAANFEILYHDVVWIHGLHRIQELELHLLVITTMFEGEMLSAILGLQ